MATGPAAATANALLDAVFNATNYTAPTEVWIKLHNGDPGSAGTSNAFTDTTRKQLSSGAASAGAIASDAALTWTSITATGTEDPTHWSAWTASSGGAFLWSGTLTSNPVVTGDTLTISSGDLDVSFTNIAA